MLITSASNPTLKLVRKLLAQKRKREELGLFAVEGEDLVEAAAAAGIEPIELPRRRRERRARAARRDLDAAASGSRRRRLPHAPPCRKRRARRRSRSGASRIPATSARCFAPRTPSAPRSRSPRAAPTRSARRRCARRPGRSSACRCSTSTTRRGSGSRSSRTAAPPLHELDLAGPTTFVLGAEREGLPEEIVGAAATRPRRSRRRARPSRSTSPSPARSRSTSARAWRIADVTSVGFIGARRDGGVAGRRASRKPAASSSSGIGTARRPDRCWSSARRRRSVPPTPRSGPRRSSSWSGIRRLCGSSRTVRRASPPVQPSATTVVQMTTVDPAAISQLESSLPRGAGLLDAPVLGSLARS